ncbi:helix-turn-helix transcriptional regulator [Neobacillus niacini]|uniref:helix-turn-helix domain-containing protein n=1 Tax=Neobacillus niacini TaxID=86668 RepID=UPI002865A2A9|nr:helix-turn-helix transcriptional regulator [Neobacillus niacini]MDR7000609.1 XRE family transcriptional regulator of biofilm formation [Neobacillus niacini]
MLGEIIYDLRKKRGYSLSELSEKANISKSYLSNIERNLNRNPSIQVLRKIAQVLNVDMKTLLQENGDEKEPLHDKELIELVNELKESGIEKNEYKTLIEFIKWQNQNFETKK